MAHFIELRDSGRWRHYYAQPAQIHEAVREAARARDEWAKLACVCAGAERRAVVIFPHLEGGSVDAVAADR